MNNTDNSINNIKAPRPPPICCSKILDNIEKSQEIDSEVDALYVTCVCMNKFGNFLATGGRDGIVRIFKYDFIDLSLNLYDEILIKKLQDIERIKFCHNSDSTSKYLSICNRSDMLCI